MLMFSCFLRRLLRSAQSGIRVYLYEGSDKGETARVATADGELGVLNTETNDCGMDSRVLVLCRCGVA